MDFDIPEHRNDKQQQKGTEITTTIKKKDAWQKQVPFIPKPYSEFHVSLGLNNLKWKCFMQWDCILYRTKDREKYYLRIYSIKM